MVSVAAGKTAGIDHFFDPVEYPSDTATCGEGVENNPGSP
jgi:hypothetical protein